MDLQSVLIRDPGIGAIFDTMKRYRYSLLRQWNPMEKRICFVMLNPSTADDVSNDPTVTRCETFSRGWGYGSLEVVNLFACRATDPRELRKVPDPIGPENDAYIELAAKRAAMVIVAWGTHGSLYHRDRDVKMLLRGFTLYCLGTTKHGHPKHPLYLKGSAVPEKY